MTSHNSNGLKLTVALHAVTWALLGILLGIGVQIRSNDLEHIYAQVQQTQQLMIQHMQRK